MRKLLLAALCASLVLTVAPAALAQQEDLDCSDFASQAEAQATLRANPGDPYGLDGPPGPVGTGEPGVACEGALPGPVDFAPVANEGLVPGSGTTGIAAATNQYTRSGPVLEEDGTVTIGGDVGTDCRSFAISIEQGYLPQLTGEQVQGVLEQCRLAGFLPPDGQYEAPVALPDTGGPGLVSPVLAGGVLLLTSLGALRLTVLRRRS